LDKNYVTECGPSFWMWAGDVSPEYYRRGSKQYLR
jgi:hypothetical protein